MQQCSGQGFLPFRWQIRVKLNAVVALQMLSNRLMDHMEGTNLHVNHRASNSVRDLAE